MLESVSERRIFRYCSLKGQPEKAVAKVFHKKVVSLGYICFVYQFLGLSDYSSRWQSNCYRSCLCFDVHIDNDYFYCVRYTNKAQRLVLDMSNGDPSGADREGAQEEFR